MIPQRRRRSSVAESGQRRRHRPDYWLVTLSLLLLALGLIVVYSISPGLAIQKHVGDNYFVTKQLIAVGLGIGAFLTVINIPLGWWRRVETPLLVLTGISAIGVRLFGEQVNGAYRWIQIGGISFQPAELIKFALILWLAGFLSDRIKNAQTGDFNATFKPLIIVFVTVAFIVGVLQTDLGSTGVIAAIMGVMIYIAGLPLKRILTIGGIVVFAAMLLILSSGYRRQRLSTFLNPSQDCQNEGYQACQALITVGSGGMFGLGLGRSVQAYGYLPEAANDSIFAIFAEKFGFVGTVTLLGIFVALFTRMKRIMEHAPDVYSRLIVAGVLAWLSTQTIINVGAMVGLLPLKGITLPFISYGGTSILFVTAAIGLVFNISRYTTYTVQTETERGSDENRPFGGRNRRPHYAYSSRRA